LWEWQGNAFDKVSCRKMKMWKISLATGIDLLVELPDQLTYTVCFNGAMKHIGKEDFMLRKILL